MIAELAGCVAVTTAVVAPSAIYAGARLRIERDEIVATRELDEARLEQERREQKALAAAEGEGHKILEARLLDAARRAFPDQPWGTVESADGVLEIIESEADRLRAAASRRVERDAVLADALRRARQSGRLPRYLEDAAVGSELLR